MHTEVGRCRECLEEAHESWVQLPDCWNAHLFLVNCYPVCAREPPVSLDVVDSILEVSVPLGEVHLQQISQKIFQVRAEV